MIRSGESRCDSGVRFAKVRYKSLCHVCFNFNLSFPSTVLTPQREREWNACGPHSGPKDKILYVSKLCITYITPTVAFWAMWQLLILRVGLEASRLFGWEPHRSSPLDHEECQPHLWRSFGHLWDRRSFGCSFSVLNSLPFENVSWRTTLTSFRCHFAAQPPIWRIICSQIANLFFV